MPIHCGTNYAGFGMKCILQESGSVEVREQSLEMCDLYSAAPNTFVLLWSCISFASLSLSLSLFFSLPSDALSLPAATLLVLLHLAQPTALRAAQSASLPLLAALSFSILSSLFPLYLFFSFKSLLFFVFCFRPPACVGETALPHLK